MCGERYRQGVKQCAAPSLGVPLHPRNTLAPEASSCPGWEVQGHPTPLPREPSRERGSLTSLNCSRIMDGSQGVRVAAEYASRVVASTERKVFLLRARSSAGEGK